MDCCEFDIDTSIKSTPYPFAGATSQAFRTASAMVAAKYALNMGHSGDPDDGLPFRALVLRRGESSPQIFGFRSERHLTDFFRALAVMP